MCRPKFPYAFRVREVQLDNFLVHNAVYNPSLFKRYRYRALVHAGAQAVEVELSKYTCEREGRDYRTWPLLLGALAGLGCFAWVRQGRRLRDDLLDPGRETIYAAPWNVWLRLARMRLFGYASTRALLFAELEGKREVKVAGWQTAKWKKDFLLAERLHRFQRGRGGAMDFVELGDADLMRVPG